MLFWIAMAIVAIIATMELVDAKTRRGGITKRDVINSGVLFVALAISIASKLFNI